MLDLWIPCRPGEANKNALAPVHVAGVAADGSNTSRWMCPHCKHPFFRRKPCLMHMGMVMNVPASCSVLTREDERRRSVRAA